MISPPPVIRVPKLGPKQPAIDDDSNTSRRRDVGMERRVARLPCAKTRLNIHTKEYTNILLLYICEDVLSLSPEDIIIKTNCLLYIIITTFTTQMSLTN